ncbi:MAG: hypothetical protein QFB86_02190 [Patescibacteria group bacterium]|nr:hypothetical protein [Patescibacteria group bacterium]
MNNSYLDVDEKVLVVIGPSGSGKTTLVQCLSDQKLLEITPSWTTRPPRTDEMNAHEHKFVSQQEFAKLQKEGFFLETARLFGLPYTYGLPRITHNNKAAVPAIMLRSMVLGSLGHHYKSPIIYQIESHRSITEIRLQLRGGNSLDFEKRMQSYVHEIADGRQRAHRIFKNTDSFEQLLESVQKALRMDFKN